MAMSSQHPALRLAKALRVMTWLIFAGVVINGAMIAYGYFFKDPPIKYEWGHLISTLLVPAVLAYALRSEFWVTNEEAVDLEKELVLPKVWVLGLFMLIGLCMVTVCVMMLDLMFRDPAVELEPWMMPTVGLLAVVGLLLTRWMKVEVKDDSAREV